MVDHEMMKVYELAKELGLPPLNLLDRLNELNIRVKSHMSELTPEQVQAARSSLLKKEEGTKSSTASKKTGAARTRKKAAEPAAEAAPPAAAVAAAAPAATSAAPAAAVSAGPAVAAKAATPIIRRRSKTDGTTETSVSGHLPIGGIAPGAESQDASIHSEGFAALSGESTSPALDTPVPAAPRSRLTIYTPQAPEAPVSGPESAAGAESAGNSGLIMTELPAEPSTEAAEPDMSAASTEDQAARPARAPIVLPPRPAAPKRSFLKIAQPTAPQKPVIISRPTGPAPGVVSRPGLPGARPGLATGETAGTGFRGPIRLTKENLDQMAEEERNKRRTPGRETEIRPEDVKFADYRKKEMVFLPKKKRIPTGKAVNQTQITTPKAAKRVIEMENSITVAALADQLGVKSIDVIRKLMGMGQMATMNQSLDFDTATLVAGEYQYEVRNVSFKENTLLDETEDAEADLAPRPPVVTIMGHVDHGKTSLLDAIREANVAGGEAGGITQHIGAYTVVKDGHKITFIDTPGHEAFTVMRARGANVTDIVILVVAADDGVMPQTREALSHAKAAGVPIIVAMNKIDKPGANPEKIKQQLAELDLLSEDWGGQTMFVPVSAIKKTNLDKLLESILLQAEVLDLKGNPKAMARGTVLEARVDKGRGPVVSLLVRRGTLRIGDNIVSGLYCGRVKAMMDHLGRSVKEVAPGMAAEILGFEGVPNAGDRFDATKTEGDAREIASNRQIKAREQAAAAGSGPVKMSLEDLFSKVQSGTVKELPVILKADVFGSVEAIRDSLVKIATDKVKVKVIHSAPGGITESDVLLATASKAVILGFNVRPETKARQVAEAEHIEIKCYNIIYELLDDIKKAMVGLLDKKKVERFLGRAEVRQTFTVPKIGTIAGCGVIDGKMMRGANVRLLRDSRVIFDGKMSSLKRFKDDAKEVAQGYECGIGLENYNDLKSGDIIEAYTIDLVTPELGA